MEHCNVVYTLLAQAHEHGSLVSTQTMQHCELLATAQHRPFQPWLRYPLGGWLDLSTADIEYAVRVFQQGAQAGEDNYNTNGMLALLDRVPTTLGTYYHLIGTEELEPHPLWGRLYGPKFNPYPQAYLNALNQPGEEWCGAAYVVLYMIPLQAWAMANQRFVYPRNTQHGTSTQPKPMQWAEAYGPCLALFDSDFLLDTEAVAAYDNSSHVDTLEQLITRVSFITFAHILHKRIEKRVLQRSRLTSTFTCTVWFGSHFMPLVYDMNQAAQLAIRLGLPVNDPSALFATVDYVNNCKERTVAMPTPVTFDVREARGAFRKHTEFAGYRLRLPIVLQHLYFGLLPVLQLTHSTADSITREDALSIETTALYYAARKSVATIKQRMAQRFTAFFAPQAPPPLPVSWWTSAVQADPLSPLFLSCYIGDRMHDITIDDIHDPWMNYGWATPRPIVVPRLLRMWYALDCRNPAPPDRPHFVRIQSDALHAAYDAVVRLGASALCPMQLVFAYRIDEDLAYRLLFEAPTAWPIVREAVDDELGMEDVVAAAAASRQEKYVYLRRVDQVLRTPEGYQSLLLALRNRCRELRVNHEEFMRQAAYLRTLELRSVYGPEDFAKWFTACYYVAPTRAFVTQFVDQPSFPFPEDTGYVSALTPVPGKADTFVRDPQTGKHVKTRICKASVFYTYVQVNIVAAFQWSQLDPSARVPGTVLSTDRRRELYNLVRPIVSRLTSAIAVPVRKRSSEVSRLFESLYRIDDWSGLTELQMAALLMVLLFAQSQSQSRPIHGVEGTEMVTGMQFLLRSMHQRLSAKYQQLLTSDPLPLISPDATSASPSAATTPVPTPAARTVSGVLPAMAAPVAPRRGLGSALASSSSATPGTLAPMGLYVWTMPKFSGPIEELVGILCGQGRQRRRQGQAQAVPPPPPPPSTILVEDNDVVMATPISKAESGLQWQSASTHANRVGPSLYGAGTGAGISSSSNGLNEAAILATLANPDLVGSSHPAIFPLFMAADSDGDDDVIHDMPGQQWALDGYLTGS